MHIENFIAEFKKTFVYDLLSKTLTDEQLFEHAIDDDGVTWFKEQTRQMWSMWEKAQAKVAAPEDFQTWFKSQPFYEKLVYQYGDRLFDRDCEVYRAQPVDIAYRAYKRTPGNE